LNEINAGKCKIEDGLVEQCKKYVRKMQSCTKVACLLAVFVRFEKKISPHYL